MTTKNCKRAKIILAVFLIATLALVTYMPSIVTWLPNLLLG
jgi:TRAP-type C4-dicarboxylate transport system permease large subunit